MSALSELGTLGKTRGTGKRQNKAAFIFLAPWLIGLVVFTIGPMFASLDLASPTTTCCSPPRFIGLDNCERMLEDDRLHNRSGHVHLRLRLGAAAARRRPGAGDAARPGHARPRLLPLGVLPAVTARRERRHRDPVAPDLRQGRPRQRVPRAVRHRGAGLDLESRHALWTGHRSTSGPSARRWSSSWPASGRSRRCTTRRRRSTARAEWQQFFSITLPLLTPIIFFNLVLQIIGAFQSFTQAYVVSGGTGGPADSTLFYTLYLYQQGFANLDMGYASAMAWLLLLDHRGVDRAQLLVLEILGVLRRLKHRSRAASSARPPRRS